ncbi:MAG: VOC family protein [Nitrososphaerota archaeon]|jgi:PhnB protein|nr:VOC family protein [Nitrososphaerota archaeon]
MKVSPHLTFNGNCEEAIRVYEKAFNAKATYYQYKDTPPTEAYQPAPGTENLVMHGTINIGSGAIMFADSTPDRRTNFGNGITVCVELANTESIKAAFEVLKQGGQVSVEPQETFWSKCFCALEDKFGVNWMITLVMG